MLDLCRLKRTGMPLVRDGCAVLPEFALMNSLKRDSLLRYTIFNEERLNHLHIIYIAGLAIGEIHCNIINYLL